MEKVIAYYFANTDRKLRYGDNREIVIGETHSVEGGIKLCKNGLHASIKSLDALQYAPGSILYIVELSGDIARSDDKLCARNRKYIKGFDATELLREFARKQALINIEKIKPYTTDDYYNLIIDYLNTGDESKRSAARSAVKSARSAAISAERSARSERSERSARSAAWSARSAMWSTESAWSAWSAVESAKSAVESAAESAERSAAESAERSAVNEMLEDMIKERLKNE